jgi:hypothetical protein
MSLPSAVDAAALPPHFAEFRRALEHSWRSFAELRTDHTHNYFEVLRLTTRLQAAFDLFSEQHGRAHIHYIGGMLHLVMKLNDNFDRDQIEAATSAYERLLRRLESPDDPRYNRMPLTRSMRLRCRENHDSDDDTDCYGC